MIAPVRETSIFTSMYQTNLCTVCEFNGSKFALFDKAIDESKVSIDLSDCNVVFLVPIEAEENLSVKAISVIALSTLTSKQGMIEINASGRIITLGAKIKSHIAPRLSGNKGVDIMAIIDERREMILRLFKEGIAKIHGLSIANALLETFDATKDPTWESEDSHINVAKALEYFSIPATT